jgi:adenylosuccinate lyase
MLIRKRVKVEINWLLCLLEHQIITAEKVKVPIGEARTRLARFDNFTDADFEKIKAIEKTTNHDIKAVEYFIKGELPVLGFSEEFVEYTHFLCTSEDINNISYSLMLKDFKSNVLSPTMQDVITRLKELAKKSRDCPMLSRTHGQPATPTSMGKEMANFTYRLNNVHRKINELNFSAKMNGAVGNYNAHYLVDPSVNWLEVTRHFIQNQCHLDFNMFTTQIEPHDSMCEFFGQVHRFNTIALGMSQDIWGYIAANYFKLSVVKGEIGSSIMPHKVNPIDFENAEGNLGLANSLLEFFNRKLPISRFQRDLSDSTVLRNIGLAMGHSILSYESLKTGISKINANEEHMKTELDQNLEVLAEPIQQILRNDGYPNAYELLKEFTRGKRINRDELNAFIKSLPIDSQTKDKLLDLTPSKYIGIAPQLVDQLDSIVN